MAVSGRAGLFTIDDRFFSDLRGMPYTSEKRQKSGALRLEFGQFTIPTGATTGAASVLIGVTYGIMGVLTPNKVPTPVGTGLASAPFGAWSVAMDGPFSDGYLDVTLKATGQYSGQQSGMGINYMVVGYD